MQTTTRQRPSWNETEHSKWLRQEGPDSHVDHWSATNLDYLCEGCSRGCEEHGDGWMLIETKTHLKEPDWWQIKAFKRLHSAIMDPEYKGFHFIQFENE